MDFYQSLGYLIVGSRMRRLSEYLLAEINKVYQEEQLDFDASWFPLFYVLSEKQELSIRELADRIQVSHSAVSQLVSNLKKRGLVQSSPAEGDARKQLIRFSPQGAQLLEKIRPVWQGLTSVMEEMACKNTEIAGLLSSITALETEFGSESLSSRMHKEIMNKQE